MTKMEDEDLQHLALCLLMLKKYVGPQKKKLMTVLIVVFAFPLIVLELPLKYSSNATCSKFRSVQR